MKKLAIILMAALAGCSTYKGGKIVEGTDIAAGMSIPQSGGTFQIDALNFLTGFRFLFCDNAGVKCVYTTTNSVSAFGVYSSSTVKRIEVELTPTLDEAEDEDGKGSTSQPHQDSQSSPDCADGSCEMT